MSLCKKFLFSLVSVSSKIDWKNGWAKIEGFDTFAGIYSPLSRERI